MVLRLLRILFIPVFAFVLSACPGSRHPSSKLGAEVRVVKGDPGVFIKGTTLNGLRPLPAEISSETEWDFDISGFREEWAITDVKKAVKDQEPETHRRKLSNAALKAQVNETKLILKGSRKGQPVEFTFIRSDNGWTPSHFAFEGFEGTFGQGPMELIHTSVTPNHEAFSLLVQSKKPGERLVYALIFAKAKPVKAVVGNTNYEYLFGQGVKVGWAKDKPRPILICGNLPDPFPRLVEDAVKDWGRALDKRLQFISQRRVTCPPFSDLNTQTFQFLQDWIEIQGPAGVTGETIPIAGPGREQLLDGDVFILLAEYEEGLGTKHSPEQFITPEILAQPRFQEAIRRDALHEIGHLLGLHHQFKPKIPSIMSYDSSRETKLHDYDIKAIQHLYED